jgi:hypothetical protein
LVVASFTEGRPSSSINRSIAVPPDSGAAAGGSHSSFVVDDLKRAAAKHRSLHVCPDPDAPRADVHSGLRQQKHQQPEIDGGENEKQSLTPHDSLSSAADLAPCVAVPRYTAPWPQNLTHPILAYCGGC